MAIITDNNFFIGGLNTDYSPENQPENTYYNLKNAIRKDSGELVSEYGTIFNTILPNGMRIIGSYVLRDDIILFLCNQANTQSEIGIVDINNVYTPYINNRGVATNLLLPGNYLNFKITQQVDVEGRILYNNDRVVYFTDNFNEVRKLRCEVPTPYIALEGYLPITSIPSTRDEGTKGV